MIIFRQSNGEYPFTRPSLIAGIAAGCLVGLMADSALVGFAVFVLLVTVGVTWSRSHAVVIPFVLAYQWIAVTVGYFYSLITGVFPSAYPLGDLERTLSLSLFGLLLLAIGIRLVASLLPGRKGGASADVEDEVEIGNLRGLFWLVMAFYAVDYLYVLNTRAFSSVGAILARILDFRQVLLMALWWEVMRRRERMRYIWITLAWVFVPLLGSYLSDFKTPLIFLLIVSLSLFRPWERESWRFSKRQVLTGVVGMATLVFVVLLWQAGVKKDTRKVYDASQGAADPLGRVSLFVKSAQDNIPVLLDDPQSVIEGLVARISYITFFSRVLDYVPRVQPHTNGELLRMAVTNTVMPRFLFPDKPELPSDSAYTRRFTGIMVAEENTSISIGYMAEFYVDWGVGGMLAMVFVYGCWIGLAYWLILTLVRPAFLVNPVLVSVLMSVYQFEHQFIKTFAALNIALIVAVVLVLAVRRPLVRFLDLRLPSSEHEPLAVEA